MLAVRRYHFEHRIKLLYIHNTCIFKYISTTATSSTFDDITLKNNEAIPLNTYTSVQDYYAGKSVFITGGTGFLGKTLLEKLLYTCTKLDKIYLLIREKDGDSINRRLEDKIFKNPLFDRLKEHLPDSLNKVIPIAGDITEPNLAIRNDDAQTLVEKVSVVFHAAASVKFNEPWDLSLKNNYESTEAVLKLCQRMKKVETFVHVSTAYAFTRDVGDNVVEEKLYPAPADIDRVYSFAKNYNNDSKKSKLFLGGLANSYTYAKALAETYIAENHGNIPTCIVRPSIVGPKIDEPQIGCLDNWFGASYLLLSSSIGLNRVIRGTGYQIADIIPVDYVANTCIVAAAKHDGSKHRPVYNSCSSEVNPVTWREAYKFFKEETDKQGWSGIPLPFIYTKSKELAAVLTFVLQIIPAYLIDFYLVITGKKPRYVKIQDRVILLRNTLNFFTLNTWVIKSGNVRQLYSSLSERDRHLFPCDPAHIDWRKYFYSYSQGVHKFLLSKNNKS